MLNPKDLLSVPAAEVERPKAAPKAFYHGIIRKYEWTDEPQYGEDPSILYKHLVLYPTLTGLADDTDPSTLEGVDLSKISMGRFFSKKYIVTAAEVRRIYDLIETFGHDTSGHGVYDFIPELRGAACLVEVDKKPVKGSNNKEWFNTVKSIKGLPA